MTTSYHINASELSIDFVKAIKTLFKDKDLFITVATEMDETEYLLSSESNRKILEESLKNIKKGKLIEVDIDKYLKK